MQTVDIVEKLIVLAELASESEPEVIVDKAFVPPTGDKRTYVSLATYCWPSNPDDLENPKGPWTCTDGKAYPGVCRLNLLMLFCSRRGSCLHCCEKCG
jgi:hypothetical protein